MIESEIINERIASMERRLYMLLKSDYSVSDIQKLCYELVTTYNIGCTPITHCKIAKGVIARRHLLSTTGISESDFRREKYLVCHRCDNPPCSNLGHLFIGTASLNQLDRQAKYRQRAGQIGASQERVEELHRLFAAT